MIKTQISTDEKMQMSTDYLYLSANSGIALIIVLATFLFVSLIGIAIMQIAMSHSKLSLRQISHQRAYYAVQAGLEHAMWELRNNQANSGSTTIDGITVTLGRAQSGHPTLPSSGYTINAIADY